MSNQNKTVEEKAREDYNESILLASLLQDVLNAKSCGLHKQHRDCLETVIRGIEINAKKELDESIFYATEITELKEQLRWRKVEESPKSKEKHYSILIKDNLNSLVVMWLHPNEKEEDIKERLSFYKAIEWLPIPRKE